MTSALLANILVLCGLAGVSAFALYFISQKFAIKHDPLIDKIYEILPHANCGACGHAGCQAFAESCAKADESEFAELNCPVGGQKVMNSIAAIKGFQAAQKERTCAVLMCQGSCQNSPMKTEYTGIQSCRAASQVMSSSGGCPNGCLHFGDCVKVCKFGALSMNPQTQMPEIDYNKCTSCGACVQRCPRGLFEIRVVQDNSQVYTACRNKQKGAIARKNCLKACIACGKCAKINPEIEIKDNLSYIPSSVNPSKYGQQLAEECPTKAIVYRENMTKGED